ncbi:g11358 [Coccomyxa viridis]|uniref:glutaredoxin-dependent peroxiredoxin n=1 Tax=Coccomyxa viridis TaxID=1274662 RepID=A0ABP1G7S4_9CHLO
MALIGKTLPKYKADQLRVLKGEPLDLPPDGYPAVIELWATWCGPCRQVAPHLSNIARKYRDKGLKVMGLSLDDVSPTLHQFVASQGDKMDYTVAVDQYGRAGQVLMSAARVSGIPHAFVLDDKGIVQYHGHPADPQFERAVKQVVASHKSSQPQAVKQSREELSGMPVRELKTMLQSRNISFAGVTEKPELVQLVWEQCH